MISQRRRPFSSKTPEKYNLSHHLFVNQTLNSPIPNQTYCWDDIMNWSSWKTVHFFFFLFFYFLIVNNRENIKKYQ
jgi:hypothetical protein